MLQTNSVANMAHAVALNAAPAGFILVQIVRKKLLCGHFWQLSINIVF